MPHLSQVEAFQDAQLLEEHRPLGPGRAFVDLQTPVIQGHAAFDAGVPFSHVLVGKQPLVGGAAGIGQRFGGDELHDSLGDGSLVESVPGRLDPGGPTLVLGLFLGGNHGL